MTERGPRARTLASFTVLGPAVLARAGERAQGPFDAQELLWSASRKGVPIEQSPADAHLSALLRRLSRGDVVRPGLRQLALQRLGAAEDLPEAVDEDLADWIGSSLQERGAALRDLLGLVDRLPRVARTPLRFPGLSRSRLGVR